MAVNIVGVTGKIDSIEQMMENLRRFEASNNCTVQIFRADRIFGKPHLEVAVEHAQRSFEQSRNRSKHLGTEILLYCAAERQIKNAIELLGITEENLFKIFNQLNKENGPKSGTQADHDRQRN